MKPLARLVTAREDDRVLAPGRLGLVGDEDAVRHDLPVAAQPALGRRPCPLGDGDAPVDPVHEEAPPGHPEAHPGEVTGGVVRRHDRRPRQGEDRNADGGRHRLVEMEDIEPLALERPPDPEERTRAQDDVRQ